MIKFTHLAIVAAVLLTGATSAMAQTVGRTTSETDPYAGNNPNSPEGNRAYWDYQGRHGN